MERVIETSAGEAAASRLEKVLVQYCLWNNPEELIERRRADLEELFERFRDLEEDRRKLRKIAREYGLEGIYDDLRFKDAWQKRGCLSALLEYPFDR
jgi:hypothetical protein